MADDDTLTIGQLALLGGVGKETLRCYKRIGLLAPVGRRKGAYRRYSSLDLARLRFIRRAGQLGFTLAETKELLSLRAREGAPCAGVRAKASARLEAIEQKLAELTELRDAVAALVHTCRGEKAVEHCTILAALGDDALTANRTEKKNTKKEPPNGHRHGKRDAAQQDEPSMPRMRRSM